MELTLALVREAAEHCRLAGATPTYEYTRTLGQKLRKIRRLLIKGENSITQLLRSRGERAAKDDRSWIISSGRYTFHSGVHPFWFQ